MTKKVIPPIDPDRFDILKPPPDMGEDWTYISFLLDKSGSMNAMRKQAVDGYNGFIAEQQTVPGKALLQLTLFNDKMDKRELAEIGDAKPLTDKTYSPGGGTAYLDALAQTIRDTRQVIACADTPPSKVLYIIMTDGQENASTKASYAEVKKLIAEEKKEERGFVFLGANMDTVQEGATLAVNAYDWTASGAQKCLQALSAVTCSVRSSGASAGHTVNSMDDEIKSMLTPDDAETPHTPMSLNVLRKVVKTLGGGGRFTPLTDSCPTCKPRKGLK